MTFLAVVACFNIEYNERELYELIIPVGKK